MTFFRTTTCLLLLALLAGCASSSVFNPWPQQAESWRQMLTTDQHDAAMMRLNRGTEGRDRLLFLQERARVAQLAGDYQSSVEDFRSVIQLYDDQDREALFRLTGAGAGGAAMLTNDNAIPYSGEDYERIMSHGLQALNYWALGELDSAAVEFRRVTLEQQVAQQQRDREIARARERAADEEISLDQQSHWLSNLNAAAGEVRSSIQNAWFYYLAGVFREGVGDYNNAIVDYRKALEIHPRMPLLREDIERVSAKQEGRYQSDNGLVVIAYEQGLIPPKREINLPIPTLEGYVSVAFPSYDPQDRRPPVPIRVRGPEQHAEGEVLADLSAMSARALREAAPAMLVRQTLRAMAKYQTQKRANEDFGLFGAFATQIYNLVSEQADLRSWLTLPANTQIARLELPPGEHSLLLSASGGSARVEVPVVSGGITLLRVHDATGKLSTHVMPVLEVQR